MCIRDRSSGCQATTTFNSDNDEADHTFSTVGDLRTSSHDYIAFRVRFYSNSGCNTLLYTETLEPDTECHVSGGTNYCPPSTPNTATPVGASTDTPTPTPTPMNTHTPTATGVLGTLGTDTPTSSPTNTPTPTTTPAPTNTPTQTNTPVSYTHLRPTRPY